jgi:protein-disulfide isomerase
MTWSTRSLAVAAVLVGLLLNFSILTATLVVLVTRESGGGGGASKEEVQRITSEYLKSHPEVVRQVFVDMIKHPELAGKDGATPDAVHESTPEERATVIAAEGKTLFQSPHQVVLGNPNGKVTLVQFFDYNCGYCRRALGDTMALLKANPDLRFVLKEYPILGVPSQEAAKVAIALRMQDKSGKLYEPFHERLLGGGQANKQAALDAAKAVGADMKALERDMASGEVQATLSEGYNLGSKLGVSGTPSYVIGKQVIVGAVGADALQAAIAEQRTKKS